jgi:hypothetical protein
MWSGRIQSDFLARVAALHAGIFPQEDQDKVN